MRHMQRMQMGLLLLAIVFCFSSSFSLISNLSLGKWRLLSHASAEIHISKCLGVSILQYTPQGDKFLTYIPSTDLNFVGLIHSLETSRETDQPYDVTHYRLVFLLRNSTKRIVDVSQQGFLFDVASGVKFAKNQDIQHFVIKYLNAN